MKTAIEMIAKERQEQIEKHGRTLDHDVKNNNAYQLAKAAQHLLIDFTGLSQNAAYELKLDVIGQDSPEGWDRMLFQKMMDKPYLERLIIAGALIAAEIDRIEASKIKL